MSFEVRWLKDGAVVETKTLRNYAECCRDVDQLLAFYQRKFGVTRAEVWDDTGLLYLRA